MPSDTSSKHPHAEKETERSFMLHAIQNLSSEAHVDKKITEGSFKKIWAGKYLNGPRKGKPCIGKEFKDSLIKRHHFRTHHENIDLAHDFIHKFNQETILTVNVLLSVPEVWTCERTRHTGLVEPMIENFQKFNSNSGAVQSNDYGMQALSHFSYHSSGGSLLMCDIQGGKDENHYILTEPVIMSNDKAGTHGPADLGPKGILAFFGRHKCRYCKKGWIKPEITEPILIPERLGTTMAAYLPAVFGYSDQEEVTELDENKDGNLSS